MFSRFRRNKKEQAASPILVKAMADTFSGFDDPDLADFILKGSETASGARITEKSAMKNMSVLRCLSLISLSMGMLPLHLYHSGDTKKKAKDHPLYKILARKPNDWQTPIKFISTMQLRALAYGDAYAFPVRSRNRIVGLVPLHPKRVKVVERNDFNIEYKITRKNGSVYTVPSGGLFHISDLSEDGLEGIKRIKMAQEAIGLALQAEKAAASLFKNGMMVGGFLETAKQLSETAYQRLKKSIRDASGANKSQEWNILEEGLTANKMPQTSEESQHLENRGHQIEEIARAFGVPRPLLMMDDTSWGSGIEQLSMLFVQYTLAPWFTVWEQEIWRVLLTEEEQDKDLYYAKFNQHALLRGTLNDQATFFSKALGSGGHKPWMKQNEVRGLQELPISEEDGAESLKSQAAEKSQANK